jgi:hypothetical protein
VISPGLGGRWENVISRIVLVRGGPEILDLKRIFPINVRISGLSGWWISGWGVGVDIKG